MRLEDLIEEGECFLRDVVYHDFGNLINDSKGYTEWTAKSTSLYIINRRSLC